MSNNSQIESVSSLKETSTIIDLEINKVSKNKNTVFFYKILKKKIKVPIVDIPGHHHFRDVFFQKIADCKGIIMMVDSTNR